MPGGIFDSSKTRVVPVFDVLASSNSNWVLGLLELAEHPSGKPASVRGLDLTFDTTNTENRHWGKEEWGMAPPTSLLAWMIQNPASLKRKPPTGIAQRDALLNGDPQVIQEALVLLKNKPTGRVWYVFEGNTYPDAVIETPGALIVIEGKRTEPKPTADTTWLSGRHQIWRHIDAAWERRGCRKVFGMYIVEGDKKGMEATVPKVWSDGVENDLTPQVLQSSFPHRSPQEREEISNCLLGVTTWQQVIATFGLPASTLKDRC